MVLNVVSVSLANPKEAERILFCLFCGLPYKLSWFSAGYFACGDSAVSSVAYERLGNS